MNLSRRLALKGDDSLERGLGEAIHSGIITMDVELTAARPGNESDHRGKPSD